MKLSIITINYNNKSGLLRTFASVFSQSLKNFEYIVIDGGSDDGSVDVVKSNSENITFWVSERDRGIYHAMNKGIERANGEYLLFLNSGDELFSNTVISKVAPKLDVYDVMTGNLALISTESPQTVYWTSPLKITFRHFFKGTLCHPSSFIQKTAFDKYGFYDEDLKIVSDLKWFILGFFFHHLSYKKLDTCISKFYMDGISSFPENQSKIESERKSVLNSTFPLFMMIMINTSN